MNNSKLQMGKEKITSLTQNQMTSIRGGGNDADEVAVGEPEAFTYSLSMGQQCKHSKLHNSPNAYECGIAHEMKNLPKVIDQ